MSTTYKVLQGDTFESISRKIYGVETEASRISSANPGVIAPLSAGSTLVVPSIPTAPQNRTQGAPANNASEVAVLIEGKRFRFWNDIVITRSIDSMDTLEFNAPFDANDEAFREVFRPFSYKSISITVGGDVLFTGVMVGVTPELENDRRTVLVTCYSSPGVLNDCTLPASAFNVMESSGQTIREVAASMLTPFGLAPIFEVSAGAVFERVAIGTNEKVLAYLIRLAQQRNLIINSSVKGELVFTRESSSTPVANLAQGGSPLVSVIPFFNSQEYYSHVTGIEPVSTGLAGSQYTVKNPLLQGVVRPISFSTPDTLDADVKAAVEAKSGRMFANAANYTIEVATWRDPSGKLWAPNTQVNLLAPDAMIYNEYKFTIRSVEFLRDPKSETALLDLVIPGSFNGQTPSTLPWD